MPLSTENRPVFAFFSQEMCLEDIRFIPFFVQHTLLRAREHFKTVGYNIQKLTQYEEQTNAKKLLLDLNLS